MDALIAASNQSVKQQSINQFNQSINSINQSINQLRH
jgi:hypothetical protein